ncbi:MAG: hypothetical protein ISS02_00410 [Candidatus Portnoybacteria bacterium]|nr:hypothetical protein [Candidatus Portnoybacteria bacterium]
MGGMGKSRSEEREDMKLEISKLAKLLNISEEVLLDLEKKMEKVSGKKGVIEKIVQENEEKISQKLKELNLTKESKAEEVYQALIRKTEETDRVLIKHFHELDLSVVTGCRSLINSVKELTGNLTNYYLKESKARELLKLNPPKQIMASLGYGNDVDKMLEKEDCFEIFCALRFAEDSKWLNSVFFKPYKDLKKDDFEEREIKVIVLSEKWAGIGKKFLGKKLHHMSHLKEMGIVFVIPLVEQNPGEVLYLFFMSLHYIYEVDWHARLFETYRQEPDFAEKMIGALKVETTMDPLIDDEKISWRLIPAYLAKNNPDDPRLFEPHINPEDWHYNRTVLAIQRFANRFPEAGLDFWSGLNVVGDYFQTKNSEEEFISFDLFDNGISFLGKVDFNSRYTYHQQEALWNRIFVGYMGEEKTDKLMMDNLDKGMVVL